MTTLAPALCAALLAAPPTKAPAPPPRVTARVAAAIDLDSGEVLFGKKVDEPHAIASITKLLALRVILGRGVDLDGQTTMLKSDYEHTRDGARSRLMTDRPYRNLDLLHAALLGSDNRAVVALGRAAGLDFEALTAALNEEARALGLHKTRFADPTGIDHANTSTAREVAAILAAALRVERIAEVSRKTTWNASAKERSGRPLVYRNTNLLTRDEKPALLVGKTGFNSAAGWCVASGHELENGRRIGVVVLGTAGKYARFGDAHRITRWVAGLPYEPPPKVEPPRERTPTN